jgi:hypothetical protein
VHRDEPTLPNLRPPDPRELGALSGTTSRETPDWPLPAERHRPPSGYVQLPTLLLGASLGANVVLLVGMLSLLLLGHAGFLPGGSSPSGTSAPGSALSALTPTSSTAPGSGWLQVAPASVHLGCANGQQSQFVVLINSGLESVQWQANLSAPAGQAGIEVSPNRGTLNSGTSVPLQLRNRTRATGPQGVPSQQGIIDFVVDTSDAGLPPRLSYTTIGCQ